MNDIWMSRLFVFYVLLLSALAFAADSPTKLPMPAPEAIKGAMTLVQEVYKGDLAAAKMPAQKAALAKQMLVASKDEKDAITRFAILSRPCPSVVFRLPAGKWEK